MQLWQLGALVGFGVTLIVYLVHLSGGSRRSVLDSDAQVVARFADDFPNSVPQRVVRTCDADSGFLLIVDGSTGLVHSVGDRFLTRVLDSRFVRSAFVTESNLTLRFNDFTFPGASFDFADAKIAELIRQRLSN